MHRLFASSLLVVFFLTPHLSAQQPNGADLTLPSEVKGKVGEFVVIRATGGTAIVRWVLLDDGPSFLPPELLKDARNAVIFSLRPGTFRVLAYSAFNGEPTLPAICKVIIGDGPKPPAPPSPPTPPLPPLDPLAQKFAVAYKAGPETAAVKAKQRDQLSGLYAAMAEHAKDKGILTAGDLLSDMRKTSATMIDPAVLVELRKLIAAEVAAVLGTGGAVPLDDVMRAKAVDVFSKVSKALDQLK